MSHTKNNRFEETARRVVDALGGPGNLASATHCATRLRFTLRDPEKADMEAAGAAPGVLKTLVAGGQHQVVIGNDVPLAYREVQRIVGTHEGEGAEAGERNLFHRFVALISALFTPIIWALAGVAIGKASLQMALQFGWVAAGSGTEAVLGAAFDGVFYFLPFFLALTAAKHFKVNPYVALAVVSVLLHPQIAELAAAPGSTAFGLPFPSMSYASSVIPAIVAVWITGYVERWCQRVLPGALRNFLTPVLVVLVMVPLVLFTVGPVTMWLSHGVADGVNALFDVAPWLAGALMGGLWQVFVLFGLHWGFVPVFLNDIASSGWEPLLAPVTAAVMAQAAATLAVLTVTRSSRRRRVAGPAALSAVLAGVTEPAIYGVNLPLKLPFYMGIAGGAVGGAITALSGAAANAFVFPAALSLPAFLHRGSLLAFFLGVGAAMAIGYVGTAITLRRAESRADGATVGAPVAGRAVALAEIPDEVFASKAMGEGVGIVPEDGRIVSPVAGTVVAVPKSGHAFGLKTDDGVEVLVHVGLDTVTMRGEGFSPAVSRGQRVDRGQTLGSVDLAAVRRAGHPDTVILVVTNTSALGSVTPLTLGAVAPGDPVIAVAK
ncbi:beta-glucoside-specific PTS transporter subunit IIABC [Corynebacterium mastitidis]